MNKKLSAAIVGLGLFGGSLGVAQVAYAQDAPETGPAAVAAAFQTEAPEGEEGTEEGRRGRRGRGCHLETAAEAIGISVDELRSGLQAGETMADIATANGVSPDAVVEALIDQATERIDAKVAEGRITQAEADEKLANVLERIESRVFEVRPERAPAGAGA